MIARSSLALHNQKTLNDDSFILSFVARHPLLETLLRRLRSAEPDGGGQHYVLIGPRGMGKTSLLRRIAIAINREPDLAARFIPLSFREEQYNVLTLGDFWRNCGESLAEWAEATGQIELAHRLDADLLTQVWADNETSAEQFTIALKTLGRRAVLLVDNLDLILDALPGDGNWILRRYFQMRQGPIMIGAATRPLKQAADQGAAFYEFFAPVYLEPLDERQTEACMRALARGRGDEGANVIAILDKQPERVRTLHTLTGGNPRILTLIYQLLETGQSDAAMADLEILLDQVTPYYKARIEEYQTAQQRAVIDAIALNWDPITTGDLARITGIVTTTLSPLLIKLRKDGLIENVETSGSYAGHELVERFFNIWYLMRHGTRRAKQKMRWLVEFLTRIYSLPELTDLARRADEEGLRKNWRPDYAFAFNEALDRMSNGYTNSARRREPEFEMARPAEITGPLPETGKVDDDGRVIKALELARKGQEFWDAGDYHRSLSTLDEILTRFGDATETALRKQVARALLNKGFTLGQMGDSAAEVAIYDDVLTRFGDARETALREQVASALVYKGATLGQMGDSAAEVAVYDDVLRRFGDARETALREQVARALVIKGATLSQMGDSAAAVAVYDRLLTLSNADATILKWLPANSRVYIANMFLDFGEGLIRAEILYREAAVDEPLLANSSLAWLYLLTGRVADAVDLTTVLGDLSAYRRALLNGGIQLAEDNFGAATDHLASALGGELDQREAEFSDDLNRLLRLAEAKSYGDRLIVWFEDTGFADRVAPIYVAFKAYVRGEKQLLDVNPEVRRPAQAIYNRLDAPRRYRLKLAPRQQTRKKREPRRKPR